jgi:hypothetical protein
MAAKNNGDYPAVDLRLLNISVSAGPGIKNTRGLEMAGVQTLSYITDTREAQKHTRPGTLRQAGTTVIFFGITRQRDSPATDRHFNVIFSTRSFCYAKTTSQSMVTQEPACAGEFHDGKAGMDH